MSQMTRGKFLLIVGYHFCSGLTATLNLCSIYLKLFVHVLKQYGQCSCNFEINQTKIKGGCQSGRKMVPHDSKSNLSLTLLKQNVFLILGTAPNQFRIINILARYAHEHDFRVMNNVCINFGSEESDSPELSGEKMIYFHPLPLFDLDSKCHF